MKRVLQSWVVLAAVAAAGGVARAEGNVYVSRFWHNHQPVYWPDWNWNGSQIHRVQYAWDSITLKPYQNYGGLSSTYHPENNLGDIFGLDDRRAAYQGRPRDSLAACPNNGGFALSYSGSLIDNVRQLGGLGQLGYGSNWWNGNREAWTWRTPAGGRRLDLVGFTDHHSLGPLLPKAVFRKEIQVFKQAWWKAWNGASDLSDHSRGFFPTEMAFSESMIDVLADEGYQWVIVASHHLSRTCPTYFNQFDLAHEQYSLYSSPPNRADLLGPSPTTGWWYGEPNPGNAAWNVAPYAYQLHRLTYVNPETGATKTILALPSDDVLSYRYGYANEGVGKIDSFIAPFAGDGSHPVWVMPASDGDNAWGGGFSSWMEATPQFFNDAEGRGYHPSTPQDFVDAFGAAATDAHIEDGSWIFPEMDYGSPYFLKWIEPPLVNAAIGATHRYDNTQVDLETPGFALKFYSYAPLMAGANWCETAEQILRDEGGSVETWKIQAPYDWDGSWTAPNEVELAWHIFLAGLDSGFNYYGGLGNDDEVKPGLAVRRAVDTLRPWMTESRRANDRTPPTVLKPQRFPYNPGGYTFGWFNSIPGGDTRFLKKMPSEFYLWTHAYDLSGVTGVTARVRVDADGVNPLADPENETYAGGPGVGAWVSIPMTRRELPKTREALNAAAANGQIDYFLPAPEDAVADYYFAKISDTVLPGFRGKLLDYYVEAVDSKGNIHKSEIQHVYVEDDGAVSRPPDPPTGLAGFSPTGTRIQLSWNASALASSYKIFRGGALFDTSVSAGYTDTAVTPSTPYTYTVTAVNAAGESASSAALEITSAEAGEAVPDFTLTGASPDGYLIVHPGMTLYAAVRGTKLYVATWYAATVNGNDHFVFVSNQLLPSASTPALAGWGKAGLVAVPPTAAVLCMECDNGWTGWQWNDATGSSLDGIVQKDAAHQVEGVIDLVEAFSSVPSTVYLASAAYQTANGGVLAAQAPARVTDNGNLDPDEFLALPVNALRDSAGDNELDRLTPAREFRVATAERLAGGPLRLTWPIVPGRYYRVEWTANLAAEEWQTLSGADAIAAASGQDTLTVTDTPPDGTPLRIYRLTLLP